MNFARFSPVLVVASALVFSLIPSPELQAGASNKNGDPYGNGSFFPDSGSYSGIMRGTNGFVGTVEFTTSDTNTSTNGTTNSGVATVYAAGQQYVGSAYGVQDPSSQTIAVTYYGNASSEIIALPTVSYTEQTYTDQYGYIYTYLVPTYGVTNFSVSNSCSGQFSASLQNSYPNQTFSGSGIADASIQDISVTLQTNYSVTAGSTNSSTNYNYTTPSTTNSQVTYQYIFTNQNVVFNNSVTGSRVIQDTAGAGTTGN